jgi:hypothetical protein
MTMLIGFLVANALLHGAVIVRFGVRGNNKPFLLGGLGYAALAVAVYCSLPYVLWAVLVLSLVGIAGLTITFNKPVRNKTLDKLIWVLDAATILLAGYLLFVA